MMSIPPLVCSTPPPPDQCDDDKENYEFDFHYGMPQEDDQKHDYFCTFNAENSDSSTKSNIFLPPDLVNSKSLNDTVLPQIITNSNEIADSVKKKEQLDIENVIEDLDLHFEQVTISLTKDDSEGIIKKDCDKDSYIADLSPAPSDNDTTESSPSCSSGIGMSFAEPEEKEPKTIHFVNEDCPLNNSEDSVISSKLNDLKTIPMSVSQGFENGFQNYTNEIKVEAFKIMSTINDKENIVEDFQIKLENNNNDDFGDFDDFQFVSQSGDTVVLSNDVTENPWGSDNNKTTDGFGEFHADFENNDNDNPSVNVTKNNEQISSNLVEDDDDFGEFNDFKTCNVEDESFTSDDPALNLDKRDSSYMEKVEKILDSIFGEEPTCTNEKFDRVLDSALNETWGHLLEIEERQPYMVTWNNSVGQKTLLKSLCIDSRNILFTPKWGNGSMPRYAGNLCNAPLQPLRPNLGPTTSNNDASSEKHSRDWVDPLNNTGHDVINNDSTEEPRLPKPNDLPQEKPDRAYPTSLDIQPLRQINLPDTHIYTPTDSETPRSKTIHYDTNTTKSIITSDDTYSEFQDFKSPIESTSSNRTEILETKTAAKVLHEAVLQPVKVEVTMPTLNWPDPGCVIETFDDFSDFVSNSSWFANNGETELSKEETQPNQIQVTDNAHKPQTSPNKVNGLEAEFDSFQSATPEQHTVLQHSISNPIKTVEENSFKCIFPDLNTKQENISSVSNIPVKLKELESSMNKNTNIEALKIGENHYRVISDSFQPPILQPTPAVSTPKHNTTQILQPLSLESISQINWPNPGFDLQDLSRFNPVDKVHSLKSEASTSVSKSGSPVHSQADDDWGDFVSSRPKASVQVTKLPANDDDEWSDFVSSPAARPQNGLNTISFNVHTFSSFQKSNPSKNKTDSKTVDIPSLNYITPKTGFKGHNIHDPHFQNL